MHVCVLRLRTSTTAAHYLRPPRQVSICAFDLWQTQTGSVLGGERYLFGVIDLDSDFSDVTRIKSKTEVPDCIAQFIAFATSVGVTILRMHTDNEAIFHTTQARDATKSRFRAQGVMIHDRQRVRVAAKLED